MVWILVRAFHIQIGLDLWFGTGSSIKELSLPQRINHIVQLRGLGASNQIFLFFL